MACLVKLEIVDEEVFYDGEDYSEYYDNDELLSEEEEEGISVVWECTV